MNAIFYSYVIVVVENQQISPNEIRLFLMNGSGPKLYVCMCVCLYLVIGKGQIAQNSPYWGENRLKSKIKGKYKYLVFFGKIANLVPMLLQVVNSSSTKELCMQSCSFSYGFSRFVKEV